MREFSICAFSCVSISCSGGRRRRQFPSESVSARLATRVTNPHACLKPFLRGTNDSLHFFQCIGFLSALTSSTSSAAASASAPSSPCSSARTLHPASTSAQELQKVRAHLASSDSRAFLRLDDLPCMMRSTTGAGSFKEELGINHAPQALSLTIQVRIIKFWTTHLGNQPKDLSDILILLQALA